MVFPAVAGRKKCREDREVTAASCPRSRCGGFRDVTSALVCIPAGTGASEQEGIFAGWGLEGRTQGPEEGRAQQSGEGAVRSFAFLLLLIGHLSWIN